MNSLNNNKYVFYDTDVAKEDAVFHLSHLNNAFSVQSIDDICKTLAPKNPVSCILLMGHGCPGNQTIGKSREYDYFKGHDIHLKHLPDCIDQIREIASKLVSKRREPLPVFLFGGCNVANAPTTWKTLKKKDIQPLPQAVSQYIPNICFSASTHKTEVLPPDENGNVYILQIDPETEKPTIEPHDLKYFLNGKEIAADDLETNNCYDSSTINTMLQEWENIE